MAGPAGPVGIPLPSRGAVFLSKLVGGTMTFFILYRGRYEYKHILGIHEHPHDHHGSEDKHDT